MTAAHKDSIQAIHDHAANMGADCEAEKVSKVDAAELTKRDDTIKALEERIKKLEAQPVPYVTLRAVAKATTRDEAERSVLADTPEYPPLDKADYIMNADGSVDWATSYLMKRHKLAAAK